MTDDNFQNLPLNESFERVAKVAKERQEFNAQMTLRERIARAVAADFSRQEGFEAELPDDLSWDYVDQGRVDFGEVADAVIAALEQSK